MTDWLRTFSEHDQIGAIAVLCTGDADQRHTGILHRVAGTLRVLDLQWHHRLRNDPPPAAFVWVCPPLAEEDADSLAAFCRLLWTRHEREQGIPYALRFESTCFDRATGALLLGGGALGLTCATFVLAVFHSLRLPLVDPAAWPPRDEDSAWQARIVTLLRASRDPSAQAHADRVAAEIGSARFRPEEVVAAASARQLPASFAHATERAGQVLNALAG